MSAWRYSVGVALAAAFVLAASPARAGQAWKQATKLVAPVSNPSGGDAFGRAVAVSGGTVLVGAPTHGVGGAVYVFVRSGSGWVFQQELDGGTNLVAFGSSVALSGDTAFVGTPSFGAQVGVVHVFVRSGTMWSEAQAIPAPGMMPNGGFGSSMAFDGTTLIVGAPSQTSPGPVSTAYAFVSSGSTWTLQATLEDGATQTDGFGSAVAVNGDTAIVGAHVAGTASVFVRSGTSWSTQQVLTPAGSAADFGSGVAVEGDTAVVSPTDLGGAIYGFARSGAAWAQAFELSPPPPASSDFGITVALSGGTLVVGTEGAGKGGGQADVYQVAASGAMHQVKLSPSDLENGGDFGASVAIDGTTLVVGAPFTDGDHGAAYVFVYGSADGDACASDGDCVSDHCVDGVCCAVASCPGAGACNAAEHCQPGTGTCSVTPIHQGMPCAADACTTDPTCHGIVCAGTATVCPPADACHEFGACDPSTGACSNPTKSDGAKCPGGSCMAGACVPSSATPPASPQRSAGCGCRVEGAEAGWAGAYGGGLVLLLLARRRRRGRG